MNNTAVKNIFKEVISNAGLISVITMLSISLYELGIRMYA